MVPLGLARGHPGFRGLASGRKRGCGGGRAGQQGGGWSGASGWLVKGPIGGWVVEGVAQWPSRCPPSPAAQGPPPCSQLLSRCSQAASPPREPKFLLLLPSGSQASRRTGAGGCMGFQGLREQPHNSGSRQPNLFSTGRAGVWAPVLGPCVLGGSGKEPSPPCPVSGAPGCPTCPCPAAAPLTFLPVCGVPPPSPCSYQALDSGPILTSYSPILDESHLQRPCFQTSSCSEVPGRCEFGGMPFNPSLIMRPRLAPPPHPPLVLLSAPEPLEGSRLLPPVGPLEASLPFGDQSPRGCLRGTSFLPQAHEGSSHVTALHSHSGLSGAAAHTLPHRR